MLSSISSLPVAWSFSSFGLHSGKVVNALLFLCISIQVLHPSSYDGPFTIGEQKKINFLPKQGERAGSKKGRTVTLITAWHLQYSTKRWWWTLNTHHLHIFKYFNSTSVAWTFFKFLSRKGVIFRWEIQSKSCFRCPAFTFGWIFCCFYRSQVYILDYVVFEHWNYQELHCISYICHIMRVFFHWISW